MPFVVPSVAQYTIHGLQANRQIATIICMHIDTTGTIQQRSDAVAAMAGIVLNQWDQDLLPTICGTYTANSVSWVDLNSATGSVGSRSSTSTHTWPKNGGNTIAASPGNVCALVHKNLTSTRGSRRGRLYMPGVAESFTDPGVPNQLTTSAVTAYNTALTSFLGNLNQTAQGPFNFDARMAVPHILTREAPTKPGVPGKPLTGEGILVTGLTMDGTLATQRRRLRG